MNKRHVFITSDLDHAKRCITELYAMGFDKETISIVAGATTPLDSLPDDMTGASTTDFGGGAVRGAVAGGVSGLLIGLVAAAIPPLGITLAGAALTAGAGVAVGTWSGALVGSSVPAPFIETLQGELDAGRVLVLVDAEDEALADVDIRLRALGARPTDFEQPSALS